MRFTSALRSLLRSLANEPIEKTSLASAKELRILLGNHVQSQKVETSQPPAPSPVPEHLEPRQMSQSWSRVLLPLGSDPSVQSQYLSSRGYLRFGQILEDLDTFAVWLSYCHNQGTAHNLGQPGNLPTHHLMGIVTACVDRIDLTGTNVGHEPRLIRGDRDIVLQGHVTWVGRSSLESSMQFLQQNDAGTWENVLESKVVMVAKSPSTGKSIAVHPLESNTAEEIGLFKLGSDNSLLRKLQTEQSLLKIPPNDAEQKLIHSLFMQTLDQKSRTFRHRVLPDHHVWMESCKLKNVFIMFPQQRNLYGKIFGGFLMRTAFELAWANAFVFCHTPPVIVAVDDIMFNKSVEVGSLLYLSSEICYTDGPVMQIRVHAEVVHPDRGTQETTNTFHFTFMTTDGSEVMKVMPQTYADGMLYLSGKRHFDEAMKVLP